MKVDTNVNVTAKPYDTCLGHWSKSRKLGNKRDNSETF